MKKKREKHLTACPYAAPRLVERYHAGQLQDAEIRKFLYPIINGDDCAAAQTL